MSTAENRMAGKSAVGKMVSNVRMPLQQPFVLRPFAMLKLFSFD